MVNDLSKECILSIKKEITPTECWVTGSINRPLISIYGKSYYLARVVAHLWHGLDLRDPYQLACHKCNNGFCFNPEHIYNGTDSSNILDSINAGIHNQARKTTCKLGHQLDGTKIRRGKIAERYCKTCQRLANVRHRGC